MLRRLPIVDPTDPDAVAGDTIDRERIAELIAAEERPAPADRPWIATNMVTSVDGATAIDGVSGELGSDVDMAIFGAMRAIADIILVGSQTATAERYRPARTSEAARQARADRGQSPRPRIAVVSNRGTIDLGLRLFTDADPTALPIVLVATNAVDPDRRHQLDEVAEVIETGDGVVNLDDAIRLLGTRSGAQVIVCEGGPTLNGHLIADDLVDEWCLTLAPSLVGGEAARAAHGPPDTPLRRFRLARAWKHDSELFLRYVRCRND